MFDAQAIALLDEQRPTLRTNLRTALAQSGVPTATYSAAQLGAGRSTGLGAVASALAQAKFRASDVAAVRAQLHAPAADLRAASFPGDLTAASTADRKDAALMRAYVAFVRKALA